MASKYQIIVGVAEHAADDIRKNADNWMSFLTTAANNYKYRFKDQLLIHAQKPDAIACAEIDTWNRLGRWVNKGTKGIALLVDGENRYKLRHVFDVSDTNTRSDVSISLWQMQSRYEASVIESLENSFGEIEDSTAFPAALLGTAKNAVEDNLPDYLSDLISVKAGSYLEELDDLNTEVWLKNTLIASVEFMLLTRCGYDARQFFEREDFARVFDFSTPETIALLGGAASDISEMVLREIGATVKSLQIVERRQNRTFAKQSEIVENKVRNQTTERSAEYGNDLYNAGRLSSAQPDRAGEPENREIWNAAANLSSGAQGRDLHRDAPVEQAEQPSGENRPAGHRDGGALNLADGEGTGRDREPESIGSDEVGRDDEQHPERRGGSSSDGADLQLTPSEPEPTATGDEPAEVMPEVQLLELVWL